MEFKYVYDEQTTVVDLGVVVMSTTVVVEMVEITTLVSFI